MTQTHSRQSTTSQTPQAVDHLSLNFFTRPVRRELLKGHIIASPRFLKMEVLKDLEMAETTVGSGVSNNIGWLLKKPFMFHDHFPWLTDESAIKYKAHQIAYFDIFAVSPMAGITFIIIATRANIQHTGSNNYLFSLGFASTILCIGVFLICASAHICKLYWSQSGEEWKKPWVIRSERFLLTSFVGRIEDFIGLLATLASGLFLIARVKAGQCPSENIWDTQNCNPLASLHSIPIDQVIYLYTVPLQCLIVLRGFTFTALLISYAVTFAFVVVSVAHVKGGAELWVVIYLFIFVNIAFEFERWMRISFFQVFTLFFILHLTLNVAVSYYLSISASGI